MQQPSLGRTVLYCFRDRDVDLIERPAIVTGVNGQHVDITVFFKRGDSDECIRGVSGDLDCDPRYEDVCCNMGDEPVQNTWRWPPRV